MRRLLQASVLCTCISSTLALGCRHSQHCGTPCCCPPAAGQPTSAAPAAAPAPGQAPGAPTMPLVQNNTPPAPPSNPPAVLQPGIASQGSAAPSSPAVAQVLPLPPAEQPAPSPAPLTSQENPASSPAGMAPAQQPSAAELSAQATTPAGSMTLPGPVAGEAPGHDTAYHTLVGVLEYVAIQKGWVLRYGAPGEEDRYGGCVSLVNTGLMKAFHSGQRVQVIGELVDASSLKPHPAYRVFSLQPLGPQS